MLTKTKTSEQSLPLLRESRAAASAEQAESAREQLVALSLSLFLCQRQHARSLWGCARCRQYNSITETTRRRYDDSSEDDDDVDDDAGLAGARWDRLLKVVGALRPSSLKANAVNDRHSGPLFPYTDTETGSWTRVVHCSRRSSRRSRCNFKCS